MTTSLALSMPRGLKHFREHEGKELLFMTAMRMILLTRLGKQSVPSLSRITMHTLSSHHGLPRRLRSFGKKKSQHVKRHKETKTPLSSEILQGKRLRLLKKQQPRKKTPGMKTFVSQLHKIEPSISFGSSMEP